MPDEVIPALKINRTPNALVRSAFGADGWHLEIPSGPEGKYRLAQLDDYAVFQRANFPWRSPLTLNLRARISDPDIPGTWGFGLWNDPFSLSLGFGGGSRRFPALPNAAWFFFASPQNYLSFRDDKPAHGFLAQTFRSPPIPAPLLALGALGMPLLAWPWMARRLRPLLQGGIAEDGFSLQVDVTRWHEYALKWEKDRVIFQADGNTFKTGISPNPPLGLVIWIDNQYVALPPNGRFSYGKLPNPDPAWLEVRDMKRIESA